jgi:hypothetical protein
MNPTKTYPTTLIGLRHAALRADDQTWSRISLALHDAHAEQVRVEEVVESISDRHPNEAKGLLAAQSRRVSGYPFLLDAWNLRKLADSEEASVCGERYNGITSAFGSLYKQLPREIRDELTRLLREEADVVRKPVAEGIAILLEEAAHEDEWEREEAAMNESFRDGSWTVTCETCEVTLHHLDCMYDENGFYCDAHAPASAKRGRDGGICSCHTSRPPSTP